MNGVVCTNKMIRYIVLIPYLLYLLLGILTLAHYQSQKNCYIFEYVISVMCFQSLVIILFFKQYLRNRGKWFIITMCGITFTIWGGLETFGAKCNPYEKTTIFTFSQVTTVLQSIIYLTLLTTILCDIVLNDYQEI